MTDQLREQKRTRTVRYTTDEKTMYKTQIPETSGWHPPVKLIKRNRLKTIVTSHFRDD